MSLTDKFAAHLDREGFFTASAPLLIAVSGGVDSMVLWDLCVQKGFAVEILHANFRLRGKESEADEQFVQQMGKSYGCKVWSKRFDTNAYALRNRVSVQVAARELRYQWFEEVRQTCLNSRPAGAPQPVILTAHHADDNLETMMMNFFRGTGIAGLRGILARQHYLIRPLLPFRKEELITYAKQRKLNWREDSSNAKEDYTRNYFRHQVLPWLDQAYPGASTNLLQNIERFKDIEVLYHQAIQAHQHQLVYPHGEEWHIPVRKLQKANPLATVYFELVREWGFTPHQLPDLLHLLEANTGKWVASPTHRIIRNRDWLILAPLVAQQPKQIWIDQLPAQVTTAHFALQLASARLPVQPDQQDPSVAYVNATLLSFPLLLRPWKNGDYFYPLGMRKMKKVSRFLIDAKVSKTDKEKIWVLESNRKIVWVVGHRIDDRFRLSETVKEVARLSVRVL